MSPNRYVWLFVLTALGGIGCSGDDLTEDSNKSHDALTTGHIPGKSLGRSLGFRGVGWEDGIRRDLRVCGGA